MTNEERDRMIMETHDAVIRMSAMTEDHHIDLYGDNNGNKGIKTKLTLIEERQTNCPARKHFSLEGKKFSIAVVMMIIAIITALIGFIEIASKFKK